MHDSLDWLIGWFSLRQPVPDMGQDELDEFNYFNEGLIDSMGVIELIAEIEDHFHIRFEQDHFQDRRFSTIGGLSRMIAELEREST